MLVGIGRSDPVNQLTFTALADHPKGFFRFAAAGCVRFQIQSKITLLFVRPVTFVAALDENRLDLAGKIDGATRGRRRRAVEFGNTPGCRGQDQRENNSVQSDQVHNLRILRIREEMSRP